MLENVAPLITSPWVYLVVAVAVAVDGLLPVMPSEALVIATASVATTVDPARLPILLLVVTAAAVAGDAVAYTLGHRARGRLTARTSGRASAAYRRVREILRRHGPAALVVARFVPGGRFCGNLAAGTAGVGRRRFTAATAAAGTLWALYMTALGGLGGVAFSDRPLLSVLPGLVLGIGGPAVHLLFRRASKRPGTRHARQGAGTTGSHDDRAVPRLRIPVAVGATTGVAVVPVLLQVERHRVVRAGQQ